MTLSTLNTHPSKGAVVANLSITEISRLSGLTVRALKYYEEVGLLEPPRTVANARVYLGVDLDKICMIARLRSAGVDVSDIVSAFKNEDPAQKRDELATAIRNRLARLDGERRSLIEALENLTS